MLKNIGNDRLIQIMVAVLSASAIICAALITISPAITQMVFGSQATATLVLPSPTTDQSTSAVMTFSATDTPSIPTDTPTPSLPDLVVVAISNPICVRDHTVTPTRYYVRQTITVRNLGIGGTEAFGPFSARMTLIFGGQRYSTDEWASQLNGMINTPDLVIPSLLPNQDAEINLSIDLKGNTNYEIEAIANSGSATIPESDPTNNILTVSFTSNCQ